MCEEIFSILILSYVFSLISLENMASKYGHLVSMILCAGTSFEPSTMNITSENYRSPTKPPKSFSILLAGKSLDRSSIRK